MDPVRFLAWLVIVVISVPLFALLLVAAAWVTVGVLANG